MADEQAAEPAWIEAIEVMRGGDDFGATLRRNASRKLAGKALRLLRVGERLRRASLRRRHQHRERAAVAEGDADASRGGEVVAGRLDLRVKRDGGALLEPMQHRIGQPG